MEDKVLRSMAEYKREKLREWEKSKREIERGNAGGSCIYIYILMSCRREKAEFGHRSVKQKIGPASMRLDRDQRVRLGQSVARGVLGSVVGGRANSQS